MLQVKMYESENKLNTRIHQFHLAQSVCECVQGRMCLPALFVLPPRCRTPGPLLGSGCTCCRWLFGHCRQLKSFASTELFLAAAAGAALTDVHKGSFSCHTAHHYAGGDVGHQNVGLWPCQRLLLIIFVFPCYRFWAAASLRFYFAFTILVYSSLSTAHSHTYENV